MSTATQQTPANWQVSRIAGALGAEVHGIDLAQPNDADIAAIEALLVEHLVLFFPDQTITVDEHVALGRRFGPLEGHPNLKNPFTQHPELFELAASQGGVADEWHTDITFRPDPALMSILKMVTCPAFGGDTMWSNLCQAFDELSEPMQELCEGLTALHDATPHNKPEQMAIHPVVRVHPVSGRKALYVNEHFTRRIVEMNATESDVLLRFLTGWIQKPRFTVRYRWHENTIAMWDNRATQHFVLNDFEGERVIQRVTVMGDRPQGVGVPRWQPWVRPGRLSATSRHDRQLYLHLKAMQAQGD
ncbi:MAG: taurine dioxygenase [Gammaproteobacteria bacterium]|nr:MAG: taurine dioxygenase [Gammaproteobacteria bacterium]